MMVMLYRLLQAKNITLETVRDAEAITDIKEAGDYAVEAIQSMYSSGIVSGVEEGKIAPNATATRAEVAKIVNEVLTKIDSME